MKRKSRSHSASEKDNRKSNPNPNREMKIKTQLLVLALGICPGISNIAQSQGSDRRPAGIPRPMERREHPASRTPAPVPEENEVMMEFPLETRTIDGAGNNLANPTWGSAETTVLRLASIAYTDGLDSPAGEGRPSAREVSNAIFAQGAAVENDYGATDYLWQWGQFLDHDIVETPTISPEEAFDIQVPTGDSWFDPFHTGTQTIALNRSLYEVVDGVREQVNAITSYIDASNVYGSDDERSFALRTLDGTGMLKTSDGDLLPFNEEELPNAGSTSSAFFLAGDVRANEQLGLAAMHTLFVREHNHWAGTLATADPTLSDEELYQMARIIVSSEMQSITYREFLPLLLGRKGLPAYSGYKPQVNPGIGNEFAAAAYRVGHTMLSPSLLRVDANGDEISGGHVSLADAFFNPGEILDFGIAPILRGLAAQNCQSIDAQLIDEVRNFLFGPPGAGGFDLASLNIQRGRDHGLPDYNQMRVDFGLPAVTSFQEISEDADVVANLASVYGLVDGIDCWVGMLAETHLEGAMVGETLSIVLGDQFRRLRDGDRFYYRNYLPRPLIEMIEQQSLAKIIRRNTEIGDELPDNVFLPGAPVFQNFESPAPRPVVRKKKQSRNRKNSIRNRNARR